VRAGTVLGVDWYKRGWVAVALRPDAGPDVIVGADLAELLDRPPELTCIAIDMPIGLPETERDCDRLARGFVGVRRSSVFMTPPQAVLETHDYSAANAVAAELLGGRKISQQAYALRHNIKAVNDVAESDPRVIEVHPEVSFRQLLGEELAFAKTTWNGQMTRRSALAEEGIALPDRLDEAGAVPVADVLDAAVAAWSARRYVNGEAASLPADARPGDRQVIWI
jgi:predicted RNase H-like nuclease